MVLSLTLHIKNLVLSLTLHIKNTTHLLGIGDVGQALELGNERGDAVEARLFQHVFRIDAGVQVQRPGAHVVEQRDKVLGRAIDQVGAGRVGGRVPRAAKHVREHVVAVARQRRARRHKHAPAHVEANPAVLRRHSARQRRRRLVFAAAERLARARLALALGAVAFAHRHTLVARRHRRPLARRAADARRAQLVRLRAQRWARRRVLHQRRHRLNAWANHYTNCCLFF